MGIERELRCKTWAAHATVSGEPARQQPLGHDGYSPNDLGRRRAPALTREPGDLPVVVVFRAVVVRRAERDFPNDDVC